MEKIVAARDERRRAGEHPMSAASTSISTSTELFRSSWSLYDAVIGANYMFHREIETAVGRVFREKAARSFCVLDLGCGNARGLSATLRAARPVVYVGVDVSRPALDEAAEALAELPEVRLREEDMLACVESLAAEGARFDVVHSAFAMHHLSTADKARLIRAVSSLLPSDGRLLLVDVVRGEGQTRDAYLEDYLRMVDEEWLLLSAEQRQAVRDHVLAFDFPETVTDLNRMAQEAGMGPCEVLGRHREHQVMMWGKPGVTSA